MTPYHTPSPHAAQTPRYGQQTPSQLAKSPFIHPATVIGTPSQRTMQSPYAASPSVRNYSSQESTSWQQASEVWGRSRQSPYQQQQPSHQITQQPPRDHFGAQRDNYGGNRDAFGAKRDSFGSQRDNFGRRDNYSSGGRDNYSQQSRGQFNNNRGG